MSDRPPDADPAAPLRSDARRDAVLAGLVADAPGFVPELSLAQPGPARALAGAVARSAAILHDSLARLPLRSRLAFADLCGNAVQPASPARVPMALTALAGEGPEIVLPAGSRFAARLPPPPPTLSAAARREAPSETEFATDEAISLARATLACCYSIDPAGDVYADHLPALRPAQDDPGPATLFDGWRQTPHELYLGHHEHLALKGRAEITVFLDLAREEETARPRPILIDWSYLTAEGWFPLTVTRDTTRRLTRDGLIVLRKECGPDAMEGEVDGHTSHWLRAAVSPRRPRAHGRPPTQAEAQAQAIAPDPRVLYVEDSRDFLPGDVVTLDGVATARLTATGTGTMEVDRALPAPPEGFAQATLGLADPLPPLRPEGSDAEGAVPLIDGLRLTVGFVKGGLLPDLLLRDSLRLDTDRPFLPLGPEPGPDSTFFVACDEAFDKTGAQLRILARLHRPGVVPAGGTLSLAAEYWNGGAWIALSGADGLSGLEALFTADSAAIQPELRFQVPRGWQKKEVGGEDRLWLRLRVLGGDFGRQSFAPVADPDTGHITLGPTEDLNPPVMTALTLSYTYVTERAQPDLCLTHNDFVHTDRSFDLRWPRRPFAPFSAVSDRDTALHLGFSAKLPAGIVSLLVVVPGLAEDRAAEPQPFAFEYRSARGWRELAVLDGTEGFTRTGLLQFVGPGDAVATPGLGGPLMRIRARLKRGQRQAPRPIDGLWLNGVWATQMAGTRRLVLGTSDGTEGQLFVPPPAAQPVLPGAEVEVKEWTGRGADWESAAAGISPEDLRFEVDPVDGTTPVAVWVRWQLRASLAWSGRGDRHLLLDPATGILRSGAEGLGRLIPAGAEVAMAWRFGGGLEGNVAAGAVTEIRTAAPGLAEAANMTAGDGAAAAETQTRLLDRAARRLRHRLRAVSADDYAWMAREASPEVARAVARPVTGPQGAVQRGRVELVLVPQSRTPRPQPGQSLRARVADRLGAAMPAGLSRGLRITGPVYADISVLLRATLAPGARAGACEARLRETLDTYLHALHGGADGTGWAFGARLFLSQIAARINATEGVGALSFLRWQMDGALVPDRLSLPEDTLPAPGDHQITLSLEVMA